MASAPATAFAPAATLDRASVARIVEAGRFRSDGVLLETEALDLLDRIGFATPRRIALPSSVAAERLPEPPLHGERVVLKIVSPDLPHKTEAGGVRIVGNSRDLVVAAVREMERRFASLRHAGFALQEFVPHADAFGHELLLGMRWTPEFGPVVHCGPGGIHAEFLAGVLREESGSATLSAALAEPEDVRRALADFALARFATGSQRGRPPEIDPAELERVIRRFLLLALECVPDPIAELEINPMVVSGGRWVALDALLRLSRGPIPAVPAPRPLAKLGNLLAPRSIAVVGVSEKMNPGRIILQNILLEGFPPERVTVVKAGTGQIDGCSCVPSLADLPTPVDLAVLSLPAAPSAEMVAEIAERARAESVVLIAGGLEERAGMEGPVARMHDALRRARATPGGGPVVNGGNCLGIRSIPGRYNTLFIPSHKLPLEGGEASPVALITASGAFAVSKSSKLAGVRPRYTITIGNQMDLTVADYLEHLVGDDEVRVFAVYLEGFRTLDGTRFLRLARDLVRDGRTVILYRAGRTPAGVDAAASHTAAVAGDYRVSRALARSAGILVAESLEDFEDLVRIFGSLGEREVRGMSLGALSNAGYECVAIADHLHGFRLAEWSVDTRATLNGILERARLGSIVSVRNPLDVTPILDDRGTVEAARAMLADPGVDAAVVGCVPLTPALDTLAAGPGHSEDFRRPEGVVSGLGRLARETVKPWIAVVDAGALYDPMARALEEAGIATFRTMDRALRIFASFCRHRLAARQAAEAPPGGGTSRQSTRLATSTTRGRWKRRSSPSSLTRR